jgi:cystathionine beta-synthase
VIDSGEIVGSLNEASLMQLLHDGIDFQLQDIKSVMGKPLPALDENTDVSEAYRILLSGATGVVVKRKELPIGLVTRTDLVNYWISRKKGD